MNHTEIISYEATKQALQIAEAHQVITTTDLKTPEAVIQFVAHTNRLEDTVDAVNARMEREQKAVNKLYDDTFDVFVTKMEAFLEGVFGLASTVEFKEKFIDLGDIILQVKPGDYLQSDLFDFNYYPSQAWRQSHPDVATVQIEELMQ